MVLGFWAKDVSLIGFEVLDGLDDLCGGRVLGNWE